MGKRRTTHLISFTEIELLLDILVLNYDTILYKLKTSLKETLFLK